VILMLWPSINPDGRTSAKWYGNRRHSRPRR
jgi:hypothetical protein